MSDWLGIRRQRRFRRTTSHIPAHPSELAETPPRPTDEPEVGVRYTPVRCPRCLDRTGVKVYRSTPPVRYHVCSVCQMRFKSVERYD